MGVCACVRLRGGLADVFVRVVSCRFFCRPWRQPTALLTLASICERHRMRLIDIRVLLFRLRRRRPVSFFPTLLTTYSDNLTYIVVSTCLPTPTSICPCTSSILVSPRRYTYSTQEHVHASSADLVWPTAASPSRLG